MTPRECGPCTACCHGLVVEAIDKPAFVDCPHTAADGGCGRYADRPSACRNFQCLWLQGHLGAADRPDQLGVIFTTTHHETLGTHPLLVEVTPGAASAAKVRAAIGELNRLTPVLVAAAGGGTFYPRQTSGPSKPKRVDTTPTVRLTVEGRAA